MPPSDENGKAFSGEFSGDGSPDIVAGANHRDGGIPGFHVGLRRSGWTAGRSSSGSEALDPGPHLDLERPGAPRLAQHFEIGLGDRIRIKRAVRAVRRSGAPRAAHAAIAET